MKAIQLLCLTLLLALTLTACVGQTDPRGETETTTSFTDTSTTVDSETAATSDTTKEKTQRSSTDNSTTTLAARSIQNSTTTTKQNQTTTVTTKATTTKKASTKATTTTKKPTTKKTTTAITTGSVATAQYESEVLRLVNIERAKQGLAALFAGSAAAMQAADIRAAEIKTSFSHTRPNGSSCFTALEEAGVSYRAAGENIASGYRTPSAVVEGWMNSDGHRSNILSKNFTHLAVGYDNNNWVQLFYA